MNLGKMALLLLRMGVIAGAAMGILGIVSSRLGTGDSRCNYWRAENPLPM
jgi:hypothetical protein